MKILVVEDNPRILSFIKRGMTEAGFIVDTCEDGDEGYDRACAEPYDVIVLDIMLPGRDGLSILHQLRERRNTVPVILLTARTSMNERVEGLNLGADDYISKPFYMEELLARIHAIARRSSGERLSLIKTHDLAVNLITREVHVGSEKVMLTVREFSLLELLMRSPGRILTRSQILEHVWGYQFDPQTNVVDVYIKRLRTKVDPTARFIKSVRGVGYRFAKEEED